jgi:hypothetical protein
MREPTTPTTHMAILVIGVCDCVTDDGLDVIGSLSMRTAIGEARSAAERANGAGAGGRAVMSRRSAPTG